MAMRYPIPTQIAVAASSLKYMNEMPPAIMAISIISFPPTSRTISFIAMRLSLVLFIKLNRYRPFLNVVPPCRASEGFINAEFLKYS